MNQTTEYAMLAAAVLPGCIDRAIDQQCRDMDLDYLVADEWKEVWLIAGREAATIARVAYSELEDGDPLEPSRTP